MSALTTATSDGTPPAGVDMRFAGALAFSPEGVLFVGDNHRGAIHALEVPGEAPTSPPTPMSIRNIDAKVAELLGVRASAVEINDLAVHPISKQIHLSVSRIENFSSQAAIVTVSVEGRIALLETTSLGSRTQLLTALPAADVTFQVRGSASGPLARDVAKGDVSIRALAIMDLEYHDGELFVAGVGYDDFQSVLRRLPYPFDGSQGIASVEMFHIVHDQYESRAPIRAMSVQAVDGRQQLVAAYTCSPLVLVPLEDIVDGAQISARTIADLGNGQPLDMVPFRLGDEELLFVTNNSRSPQVIPVDGLAGAKPVSHEDFERGPKLDLHPVMPFGPVGKAVMFEGVPLHLALLDDHHFASITRDAYSGDLNLDVNPTSFPNRIHNLFAEMDFPPVGQR